MIKEVRLLTPDPWPPTPAMLRLTINGEPRTLPSAVTVAELLGQLGYDRRRVAVEINHEVVPAPRHAEHRLAGGDAVEIVTLVGGGAPEPDKETGRQGDKETGRQGDKETRRQGDETGSVWLSGPPADKPLVIGKFAFTSRLITG